MGIGERFAKLKAAAEERGPLEDEQPVEENVFGVEQRQAMMLPPLSPDDVVFAKTPEERSRLASGCAGLDVESGLIQPGRMVPRLVVTGYQNADGRQMIVTGVDMTSEDGTVDARLADGRPDPALHARAFLTFTDKLLDSGVVLVNQNIAFDEVVIAESAHQADVELGLVGKDDSWFDAVMMRLFELHDRGQIECCMLREQLLDLSEGSLGKDWLSLTDQGNPRRKKYALKELAKKYLGVDLDKTTHRTTYYQYLNHRLREYPSGAVDYLTADVESALHVATRQHQRAQLHGLAPDARIPNSFDQAKAAFAFQLMSAHGIRTDLSRVQQLDADVDHWTRKILHRLKDAGLVRSEGREAGTRDTKRVKELVKKCYEDAGLVVPLTKAKNGKGGGNISMKGSVLEDISLIRLRGSSVDVYDDKGQIDETPLFDELSGLYAYSQYISFQKLATTYVPLLLKGVNYPINARYDIIKETGRVSCWSPNLTNLPRGGTKTVLQRLQSKVRESFVARPGFVLCSTDLEIAELCGLAQIAIWMVGYSKLADAINAGIDPHLLLAAEQLLGIPYEEAVARKKEKLIADMRQLAKSASFGFPGGLGIQTFIDFAKANYNVYVTEDEARTLKEKWFLQWPEMRVYFRMIASMMRGFNEQGQQVGDIEQFVSGRIRGKCRYTAACNTMFQGLVSDSAKAALYEIQRACYLRGGRMYGARSCVFVHDEIITELPEHLAHEYAFAQADILVKTVQDYTPDVKIRSTPAISRAWYKAMEAVYDGNGRLVPWEPK